LTEYCSLTTDFRGGGGGGRVTKNPFT
jgi:hypothetical protein